MKDLLWPQDQIKEESKEEVVQEIIRSNYLAKKTMSDVTEYIDFYTNTYSQKREDEVFIDVSPSKSSLLQELRTN